MNREQDELARSMPCFLEYRLKESKTPDDRRVLFDALDGDLLAIRLRLGCAEGMAPHVLVKCATSIVGLFAAAGLDDLVSIARAIRALIQAEIDSPDRWALQLLDLLDIAPQHLAQRWPEERVFVSQVQH